jgi:hypothetical protein
LVQPPAWMVWLLPAERAAAPGSWAFPRRALRAEPRALPSQWEEPAPKAPLREVGRVLVPRPKERAPAWEPKSRAAEQAGRPALGDGANHGPRAGHEKAVPQAAPAPVRVQERKEPPALRAPALHGAGVGRGLPEDHKPALQSGRTPPVAAHLPGEPARAMREHPPWEPRELRAVRTGEAHAIPEPHKGAKPKPHRFFPQGAEPVAARLPWPPVSNRAKLARRCPPWPKSPV